MYIETILQLFAHLWQSCQMINPCKNKKLLNNQFKEFISWIKYITGIFTHLFI